MVVKDYSLTCYGARFPVQAPQEEDEEKIGMTCSEIFFFKRKKKSVLLLEMIDLKHCKH